MVIFKKNKFLFITLLSLALLVIFGFTLPRGARTLLIQIMAFSVFAMGYDISLGFTDQCSLGHSVFFGTGAYTFMLSTLHFHSGIFYSISLCFIAGLGVSLATGVIAVRLSKAYFVIVTAVFSSIFHLFAIDMIWLTGGDDGLSVNLPPITFGSASISVYNPLVNYYVVLFFLVVTYLVLRRISRAPLGRVFLSIKENEERAEFLGYNVIRYKLIAFVISGSFAALGGGLYAMTIRYASADFFSLYWSIIPIVWCLIGGLGTLAGPFLGVALMSVFQYYVSAWWTYYMIIFGAIILIILRVSKKGIFGYFMNKDLR
ncbi:MAG: branched-chain amino acid ABC transporter permease [Thermodesulfobacteriota bacterium]|nr:branched-chain amino acid ABC transporter permease [Thermodesulfobacteriota bacterium]